MGGMKDTLGDTPYNPTRPKAPDLFDIAAAKDAKAAGMAQVDTNANQPWKDQMAACIRDVAKTMKRFTADDIYELAISRGQWDGTHEPRALGPVMLRAAKAGVCKKADCAPINSKRASVHASPQNVWDSLIWNAP